MIRRAPLSVKVLLVALLNILLLAASLLVFARIEYRFSLSSFLLAPARATVVSVSRLIELELSHTPMSQWNAVLARYSASYPAQLALFDSALKQLAGAPVQLPVSVAAAIRRDPFARKNRPPRFDNDGPPPGDDGHPPPRHDRDGPPPDGRVYADSLLALQHSSNPARYWAGVRMPVWTPAGPEPLHTTLVWQIPSLWTEPAFFDYRPWLGVALALVASLLLCWWPLLRDITRTLQRITAATGQIAEGRFDIKLPANRRDELGSLSQSINTMSQRLSGYVHGQKRFLGDIAHELSSPVARIQAGLGILEQRVTGPESEYVMDVREDVEHMSGLVSELLAFSKSEAARRPAALQAVQLSPVVQRVIEREGNGNIVVDPLVETAPSVLAVPDLLDRALSNVVRNAVRYAGSFGPIQVLCRRENGHVALIVADQGPGLPETELENVFRPFYRPEFARQRETGGSGLGLAIVRDCIEACRGSVLCRNRAPRGLELVIRLQIFTKS